MASRAELNRNNIRAGVFVTVSLLLMMAVIIVLTGAVEKLLRRPAAYVVTFPIEQGVGYLSEGSDVRLGGMSLGRVREVELHPDDPQKRIRVVFEIDSRVELHANAQVLVKSAIIGADSWLAIPFVGDDSAGPPPGGEIEGTAGGGILGALLGADTASRATEIVQNVDTTMANAAEFSEFLREVPDEYEARVVPTLDNARAASEDIRAVTSDFRGERWPDWADAVDGVMTWAEEATARIDEAVEEGRGLLSSARSTVEDNRPQIDTIVDNVDLATADARDVVQRVKAETVDKVHGFLDRGREALDDAAAAIATLRQDIDGWSGRLGEMLANATLASQELKFATIEVRRNPWKLLYRPTADELENELLYEAARSFAIAASDLRATSDSVERILQNHGDRLGDNQAAMEQIGRDLQRSLDNYTRAQQDLLDVLIQE